MINMMKMRTSDDREVWFRPSDVVAVQAGHDAETSTVHLSGGQAITLNRPIEALMRVLPVMEVV